ncbi:uncharacterized protein LOC111637659 [Centruroides sculpturatus]|uniref:uncharacterized protein LOC111637659 n=1 Tax=Centruroides sculpturatus TaxID=218467 RepID=UPI000C6D8974|nr:uncharacterized protein LOC111637659 [Centruroides sculpturatus]
MERVRWRSLLSLILVTKIIESQGSNSLNENPTCDVRIADLIGRLKNSQYKISELKEQNSVFNNFINRLKERCICLPHCLYNNSIYQDGEMWNPHPCQICQCQLGKVKCEQLLMPGCHDPCIPNPCQNGGLCHQKGDYTDFICRCPATYVGQFCQFNINFCIYSKRYGDCHENRIMWYFNRFTQRCEEYVYSGCGASPNSFASSTECEKRCIFGLCCFQISNNPKITDLTCKEESISECQKLHYNKTYEVVAFHPGITCAQEKCLMVEKGGCQIGNNFYLKNTDFDLGCEKCHCNSYGAVFCSCKNIAIRKEIRDLTFKEIQLFQIAIKEMNDEWNQFVEMYSSYIMHFYNNNYFLLWNRLFLKHVEKHLQNYACHLTIPYFDFTTDVGNFSDSFIWQPNYFGGNGEGDEHCVPDHPFHKKDFNTKQCCLQRKFNPSIQIPNMIEVEIALRNDNFIKFNMAMKNLVGYIHNFIGGTMTTLDAPSDPVFYILHAYIDMLFWKWESLHKYKKNLNINFDRLIFPFNISLGTIFDSKQNLCVSYALPSKGHPCNYTDEHDFALDGYNSKGFDRQGFDRDGYDNEGYNILGYNRFGQYDTRNIFIYNGYNKEGYDRAGYDRRGYNKYGFHKSSYNRECYDIKGYDCEGFDRYGFNYKGYWKNSIDHHIEKNQTDYGDCLKSGEMSEEGFDQYGYNKKGLDKNGCSYGRNGPFVLIQASKIRNIIEKQTEEFLSSISRTCHKVQSMPENWKLLIWNIEDDINLSNTRENGFTKSIWSERFCFDTDVFLSECPCKTELISTCDNSVISFNCEHYPEAQYFFDFCEKCNIYWYLEDKLVDCSISPDYCQPNPCHNGGICMSSIWPTEPQLVTCQCPLGFEGPFCEHSTIQMCYLPLDHGKNICGQKQERWYFNLQTGNCERFLYNGCSGNSNNFDSFYKCRITCIIGACCWREPLHPERNYGYNKDNYDRYGFNTQGFNRKGEIQSVNYSFGGIFGLYNYDGYDHEGYDQYGFNQLGVNRLSYNRQGFHTVSGFNLTGYNIFGDHDGIIDYDEENGLDESGYDRAGYNCYGYNHEGWDRFGLCAGWTYSCQAMSLYDCQKAEQEFPQLKRTIVKFSPGKKCEEINCKDQCGCNFLDKSYKIGETFWLGCSLCECQQYGSIVCPCSKTNNRKEIRDMTQYEMQRYQQAIKHLQFSNNRPSKWQQFAILYSQHFGQLHGTPQFLPWHRFFLRLVEMELQKFDCNVTIPYFDWTIDTGNLESSIVWQVNYFGGNGDSESKCIRYHPFKEHYPPYWTPCLRRQFNNSIYLPDAINLQYIISHERYEDFRINLEASSSLFHLFVGGHMSTPEAPYDPIFLSHYAFIDRIWDIWKTYKHNGVPQYPSLLRYIPMAPFGITPDDVLLNEKQICVHYLKPTKGAPCNDSEIFKFYNNSKEIVKEGIFDKFGYDKEGYRQSGFDMLGWNRQGYHKDTYNRDGFNILGYDRNGFNRFGLDRDGCTVHGDCINNVMNASIYDKYGYNIFGFDREGYDAYGFNIYGYDKNNCSFFYNGPFYYLFKSWVDEQIYDPTKSLINIKRLCPQISSLPDWWLIMLWFERNNQIDSIRNFEETMIIHHPVDDLSDYEINLPTDSSDERFCFELNIKSGCSLGVAILNCDDICLSHSCSNFPNTECIPYRCGICEARFYDKSTGRQTNCSEQNCIDDKNVLHRENEIWIHHPCHLCSCKNKTITCDKIQCLSDLKCTHPITMKNQCCSRCEGCFYRNKNYMNGARFIDPADPCMECTCQNGNVLCEEIKCNPLLWCNLANRIVPKNSCCPICAQCEEENNGSRWKEDKCLECICENGEISCKTNDCPEFNCSHPRTSNCCKICNDCEYEGIIIRNQEKFALDSCNSCVCKDGNVICQSIACTIPLCSQQIIPKNECCPICFSGCKYEGKHYYNNQMFTPKYNPCITCTCQNETLHCQSITCSPAPCKNARIPKGECCPSECPSIDCEIENVAMCSLMKHCEKLCTHGIVQPGRCCSPCTDCLYDNRLVPNSMKFVPNDSPCDICQCNEGNITCFPSQIQCQDLPCKITEQLENTCCPICKGCIDKSGRHLQHGNRWMHPSDFCQVCSCEEGIIRCTRMMCDIQCTHPIQRTNQCCPDCSGCQHNGKIYPNNAIIESNNTCEHCRCYKGNVECESKQCPLLTCTSPITVSNECCPVCQECIHYNKTYMNGESFVPDYDPCQNCTCKNGYVSCTQKSCPPLFCPNPFKLPNECCEQCPELCSMKNINYLEGESWLHPDDECQQCQCLNSQIHCHPKPCPTVPCSHPAAPFGTCCPTCDHCEFGRRLYRNDQEFIHADDICQKCKCQNGSVTCHSIKCDPLTCEIPVSYPDKCCPICPSVSECYLGEKTYKFHETFLDPRNACQECICMEDGEVICYHIPCPAINCPNPILELCCESCNGCSFANNSFPNQKSFVDPLDDCRNCFCNNGHVTCHHRQCEPVNCKNTVIQECCPICSGCVFLGKEYNHGETFINPENTCEECLCIENDVMCQKKVCTQNCTHPLSFECCPKCDKCLFDGDVLSNGEHFQPNVCDDCICTDGNVHCVTEECPALNCLLTTKLLDQCCEVCRGCIYEGKEYADGENWVSMNNPCLLCQCQGGTVTCSELHCLLPCNNPKPVENECCPVCPECELNGRFYQNGDVFTPNGDPCDTCTCEDGQLRCITRQCPVLVDCPKEAIVDPSPGNCCPTCAGLSTNCTREYFGTIIHPSNDPCFICECSEDFNWICIKETCPKLNCPEEYIIHKDEECCPHCEVCLSETDGQLHLSGEIWVPVLEPCLQCKCENGEEKCRKINCPVVFCNQDEVLQRLSGQCCEVCLPAKSLSCNYGNSVFLNEEKWQPDVCTTCECKMGKVTCRTERCLPLNCPSDQTPSVDPGQCCPHCIPKPATCVAFGDPHYRTFDGAVIHFQGTCRYVLVKDCLTGNFTVEAQNSDRGIEGVSWTEGLTITLAEAIVNLAKGLVVSVNDKNVSLPYFENPQLYIEKTGNSVLVNTDVGLKILWNGDSYAEVSVSGAYQMHTCGLCGNFNSFSEDDMRLRSGQISSSAAVFGNSWKSTDQTSCVDVEDFDPCNVGGYRARKIANTRCAILKGPLFAPCHKLIPPELYHASCVYDLCACSENDDCLCDILSTYSQECSRTGVVLNWRSATLCAITCPEDRGLMFDECGPACARTCENKDMPLKVLATQCFKPCVVGCQCSADKVLHQGSCIDPKDCP